MAEITVQDLTGTQDTIVTAAAATLTGDTFDNTGAGTRVIHVINGHTTTITATVDAQTNCDQGYDHNILMEPAAGEEAMYPVNQNRFNDGDGEVSITYSATTAVTIAVYNVPVVG